MATRILIYCPLAPKPPLICARTLDSIFGMHWLGQADIILGRRDREKWPDRPVAYADITQKYNQARQMTLQGGYDALLTVESDMILPPLTLERMTRIDADVIYGLYVSRHGNHQWLAFSQLAGPPDKYAGASFSLSPDLCREVWGRVVESAGLGMGCTFIHRRVLEKIEFRCPDGQVANDWHFALDVVAAGFSQVHDCGVVCGHVGGAETYWPTQDGGYRAEAL